MLEAGVILTVKLSCMSRGKAGMIAPITHGEGCHEQILLVLALVLVSAVNALGQAPFYQDKTLRIIAGYGAGSVDDAWTRLIGRYLA